MFLNMKGTPITVIISLDSVELTANVEVLNSHQTERYKL